MTDSNSKKTINERKLSTTDCDVFTDKKLIYLFYGRPAYKSMKTESSRLDSTMPIVIFFRPEAKIQIERIFPFDSGAYKMNLYKEFLHKDMRIEDFKLTNTFGAIKNTVHYYFDTNEKYFKGNAVNTIPANVMSFEQHSYLKLINDVSQKRADDRKSTMEVQSATDIEITSGSVEAFILPETFLASEEVVDFIEQDLKALIIPYECYGLNDTHYYALVLHLTKQFLTLKNYLND